MARPRKPHALVIEASRDRGRTLCDILDIQGCTSTSVQELAGAFEIIPKQLPDIIFCDLSPATNEAWQKLAQRLVNEAARNHILLVAMMERPDSEAEIKIIRGGFDMAFPKPLKLAHLRAAFMALTGESVYPPEYAQQFTSRANPAIRH